MISRMKKGSGPGNIVLKQRDLVGLDGPLVGVLDAFSLKNGILKLEGWSHGSRIVLHQNSGSVDVTDRFERPDVAASTPAGSTPKAGFAAMQGWDGGPVLLKIVHGDHVFVYDLIGGATG